MHQSSSISTIVKMLTIVLYKEQLNNIGTKKWSTVSILYHLLVIGLGLLLNPPTVPELHGFTKFIQLGLNLCLSLERQSDFSHCSETK